MDGARSMIHTSTTKSKQAQDNTHELTPRMEASRVTQSRLSPSVLEVASGSRDSLSSISSPSSTTSSASRSSDDRGM